jgi:hypothetical protein
MKPIGSKSAICIGVILSLLFPWVMTAEEPAEEASLLLRTLQHHGVKAEKLVFQQSGMVGKNWTTAMLEEKKKRLEEAFQVSLKPVVDPRTEGLTRYESLSQPTENSYLQVAWVGKKEQNHSTEDFWTVYLVVEYTTERPQDWERGWKLIMEGVRQVEIKPGIKTSVQGSVAGALSSEEQKAVLKKMVKSLKGHIVEGVELDSTISWSGYSPIIKGPVLESEEAINFQVASHADKHQSRTVITVGTPIIIMEY